MKKTILLLLAILLTSGASIQAGSIIIIANQDVPAGELSFDEVQRIFLGKMTTWSDGRKIVPICLKGGATHAAFLRKYLDMNPSQFDIFWKQAVFTGTGRPPKALANETDVIQTVKGLSGSIGYIDSDTLRGTLRIIEVN